jgi:hypothetical protein
MCLQFHFGLLVGLGSCRGWLRGLFRIVGMKMAGDDMARRDLAEVRVDLAADVHRLRAAGAEIAALGRVRGRRHVALQDDVLALASIGGSGSGTADSSAWV